MIIDLGVPPNKEGRPYTLPAIAHKSSVSWNPNGAMMDSLPIALHLDKIFQCPPLFPSGDASYALAIAVSKFLNLLGSGFRPFIVPRVPDHLDPRGANFFHETRTAASGKPLSEVRPTDQKAIDRLLEVCGTESAVLIEMLKGKSGKKGPFFEGEKAGYADLLLATQLAFIQRFDEELYEKFLGFGDGEFKALYKACLPWLEGQGEDKEWPKWSIS